MALNAETSVSEEDLLRVRNWLNESAIKLWLPPLTQESGETGEELREVAIKVSQSLKLDVEVGAACVEKLRLQALENLAMKRRFEETAVATLRVKLPERRIVKVSVSLTITGAALKAAIAKQTGISADTMKLVCKGHVVKDDASLEAQNVRNNALLLLINVSAATDSASSSQQRHQREKALDEVRVIRRAAEYLAARAEDDKFHRSDINLNITNQNGTEMKLPPAEKKALVLAMALHAKGKACMERENYDLALLLLLEADDEFNKCGSQLLSCVDNHGLLQLDIVWCYYKLQEVSELPDAERRLSLCEAKLEQSYGQNMQRAVRLQGGFGPEVVLFLRLHILQGVTAFYRNSLERARSYFKKAETEYLQLDISDEKLRTVLDYGFRSSEARLGLRFCNHEVDRAVQYILKRQDEKRAMAEREKEQRDKKLSRALGRTADGSWVNAAHYDQLVEMGFSRSLAAEALRQSNNSIQQSLNLMENNREVLLTSLAIRKSEKRRRQRSVTSVNVDRLVAMGYSREEAERALSRCRGDVAKAIELLTSGWSSSSDSESSSESEGEDEGRRQEDEVMRLLMPDVRGDLDEHLDSDLADERQLLQRFLDRLA